jgi:hypothetical protein
MKQKYFTYQLKTIFFMDYGLILAKKYLQNNKKNNERPIEIR